MMGITRKTTVSQYKSDVECALQWSSHDEYTVRCSVCCGASNNKCMRRECTLLVSEKNPCARIHADFCFVGCVWCKTRRHLHRAHLACVAGCVAVCVAARRDVCVVKQLWNWYRKTLTSCNTPCGKHVLHVHRSLLYVSFHICRSLFSNVTVDTFLFVHMRV